MMRTGGEVRTKRAEWIVSIADEGEIGVIESANWMQELVRCNDCIHWDRGHAEECNNSDSVCFHNGWCKPDWFCADGERKSDDQ